MRSVRRILGVVILFGVAIGVGASAPSASAYCGPELFSDGSGGGSGCTNLCPEPPAVLAERGLGWHCLD